MNKEDIMQKAFAVLKQQGKNTADGLLKYLKERNLLDDSTEKIAKQALSAASDPKNIDYTKFAEICETVAKEKGYDMENISKNVAASLFGGGTAPGTSGNASSMVDDASTSINAGAVEQQQEDEYDEEDNDYLDATSYDDDSSEET